MLWEEIVHIEIAKSTRENQDAFHFSFQLHFNKLKSHQY